ncbi:2-succinyl-5-enolpyruvyl-6-hydroxy-3-cyclohexene-1-carboxylic-acid synthase [Metabacillus iocasae]|uniref:2-succinyl-5-enolpyruvyl-6-hydroxy-3-cyclohexene-1-carboxylate synthase n=1 Tax=Priestia iocasae TaxID=2291674 RepID=A0ABS2QZE1_9BACI|nr:2-succinyl-5-enolpyruvyl-6-hydroxy-3-cyclohexene-1-carboxylic-acid synthase [Metabacillus iocasae]MBM7704810.1 2-succinyl-5-enolpyruvyl-6-hydroxy-3-cyclohexene-1-carboxylate synthase [Metabacillus iocasae]
MSHINTLTSYVASFIDELSNANVHDVVVSPGSRSTPLALLMAEHPDIRVHLNIDERSAGFFALGIAKAKKVPVALLCTSGTAAANYYPAVVEAHYSRVPLLVITADRPHELRNIGAPQAIDQLHLFGKYAKWFAEVALPEETPNMIRYIRTIAGRAVNTSLTTPAGPVHINFPLREPLVPNLSLEELWEKEKREGSSYAQGTMGRSTLTKQQYEQLANVLQRYEKGLIICGDHVQEDLATSVCALAEKLQFPIIADPLSQVRSGAHDKRYVVSAYDTFLKNKHLLESLRPDVVIRFGAMPVSKPLTVLLKEHPPVEMYVIDEGNGWRDPTLLATNMIHCEDKVFCDAIVECMESESLKSSQWMDMWQHLNQLATQLLQDLTNGYPTLFEGRIVSELVEELPEHSTLFVGNSMPIRDVDTFFINNDKSIRVLANRGANGIDGVVSTALGVSMVHEHTVLFIGDLSFYHDLNGLLAAKMLKLNLTVVLVNNDGGGIFSFLPQSKEEKHFESLFGTPTGINYEHVVHMYGGTFLQAETWEDFQMHLRDSIRAEGLHVIEVKTNRQENVQLHRKLWNDVSQEMNRMVKKP